MTETNLIASSKETRFWSGAISLLAFFVALRWNNFNAPLIRDEGEYAYAARLLFRGLAPYQHCFLQKPPMIVYYYAVAQLVAPGVFWAPRILAALFAAGAIALLGYVLCQEFDRRIAWSAMWLTIPMILLPGIEQFTANIETFMLLPLMLVIALWRRDRAAFRNVNAFVAGILAGVTFCFKYTVCPLLAAVLLLWSLDRWQLGKARSLGKLWSCTLFGGIVGLAGSLGFFLMHDGGKSLWECTVKFNRLYAESGIFGLPSLTSRLQTLWKAWWLLFFLAGLPLIRPDMRVWRWWILFGGAWLTTAGSLYGHYYILVMPFWAALAAIGIGSLVRLLPWLRTRSAVAWPALLVITLAVICWPDFRFAFATPSEFVRARVRTPFPESEFTAQRVAELTAPNDRIFVAGSEPQILFYANRLSATRFVIMYPLMLPSPVAREYQADVIQDLQQQPPAAIVMVNLNSSWLRQPNSPPDLITYLQSMLRTNYEPVGGFLPDDAAGQWIEPLPAGEMNRASLIVFKKRSI